MKEPGCSAGNVLYLAMDCGYMNVYTCKRSSGCTFKMSTFMLVMHQYKIIKTSKTLSSSFFDTPNPQEQIRCSQREN